MSDAPQRAAEAAEYRATQTELMEDLFDSEWVSALRLQHVAPLALYAQGVTTGCVVDIGDGVTQVTPVLHGHIMPHGVQDIPVSGGDVTHRLAELVSSQLCVVVVVVGGFCCLICVAWC